MESELRSGRSWGSSGSSSSQPGTVDNLDWNAPMDTRSVLVGSLLFVIACAKQQPLTEAASRDQALPPADPLGCGTPGYHVMVANEGSDRLEVRWTSRSVPPLEYRIGEVGLGTSFLRVPDHVRQQLPRQQGNFWAKTTTSDNTNYQTRHPLPKYTIRLVCSEAIDTTTR